jgi:hypothetical protein
MHGCCIVETCSQEMEDFPDGESSKAFRYGRMDEAALLIALQGDALPVLMALKHRCAAALVASTLHTCHGNACKGLLPYIFCCCSRQQTSTIFHEHAFMTPVTAAYPFEQQGALTA